QKRRLSLYLFPFTFYLSLSSEGHTCTHRRSSRPNRCDRGDVITRSQSAEECCLIDGDVVVRRGRRHAEVRGGNRRRGIGIGAACIDSQLVAGHERCVIRGGREDNGCW